MSDAKWMTDLRRRCTPPHPRKSAPHHRDFPGTPGSRGRASAVLAHPYQMGSLRSSAPDYDLGHLATECLASIRHHSSNEASPRTVEQHVPPGDWATTGQVRAKRGPLRDPLREVSLGGTDRV